MATDSDVIALDVGHSSTKASFFSGGVRKQLIFRSVVLPSFTISDEAEARRAKEETVVVGGRSYFIGDTAEIQGGSSVATGLSEEWVDTPEHTALMAGALKKMGADVVESARMVVMGLPTNLYSRYKNILMDIAVKNIPGKEVKVVPQPFGAYQSVMLSEEGLPVAGRDMTTESWAVVEVGHFSTDFMLMRSGRPVEKGGDSCNGVRIAAEHLKRVISEKRGVTADLGECEIALQTRRIKSFGMSVDVSAEVTESLSILVAEVVDTATRLIEPYARKLDGVVIAGGGSHYIHHPLKEKWPHALLANDARFAVAEGMRRYGMGVLHSREMRQKKAA